MKSPFFTLQLFAIVQSSLLSFNSNTSNSNLSGSNEKAQPQTRVFASKPAGISVPAWVTTGATSGLRAAWPISAFPR